jgi:hypothetical protein
VNVAASILMSVARDIGVTFASCNQWVNVLIRIPEPDLL